MFFNLSSCPSGWSEVTSARGRVLVGLPPAGTLAATVGTELSNEENRSVGQHGHDITDPGHVHPAPKVYSAVGGSTSAVWQSSGGWFGINPTPTGVTVDAGGTVAGTNAPYIQFMICQKD